MDDLEITKRCADRMGIIEFHSLPSPQIWELANSEMAEKIQVNYNPLTDNHHALELVKKFAVQIEHWANGYWEAFITFRGYNRGGRILSSGRDTDLNRAICLCVAKLPD